MPARERERKGQHLSLEIDARFHLQDMGAVQFQLASAILEEAAGLRQEEIVSELLSMGLAAVLDGATKAASEPTGPDAPGETDPTAQPTLSELVEGRSARAQTVH